MRLVEAAICQWWSLQCIDGTTTYKCVKNVNVSIAISNRHFAHAQKAVQDIFYDRSFTLAERPQNYFQQEVLTLFQYVSEAARDAVLLLQSHVAHFQTTKRECLERLAGQGGSDGSHAGLPLVWWV